MGYAFVSHSRWRRKPAEKLLADLRQAGVKYWIAPDDLKPGVDWREAVPEALENADALLFLSSEKTGKAAGMVSELTTALERSIPVFPVVIDGAGAKKLPLRLQNAPYFDIVNGNYEETLAQLLAALPDSIRQDAPVKPHAPQSKGYVFISYAEEDTEFVEKLRQFLKQRDYGFWDYQASDRNFHTQIGLELEEVIRGASATLSVLSPSWKQSKWAAKEFLFSDDVGTPVFLLMALEMGPTLVTSGIPYIDFTRSESKGFDMLDKELRRKGLIT